MIKVHKKILFHNEMNNLHNKWLVLLRQQV